MAEAEGVCRWCGRAFVYTVRGTPTLYCSPNHRAKARVQRQREANAALTERWCKRGEHMAATAEFAGPTAPYCRPHMAEWSRGNRKADADPLRARRDSLARYGLTFEQFDAMLATQGGRCKICSTTEPGDVRAGPRGWHVDHDHSCCNTRKKSCGECIRGIICSNCNRALGLVGEDETVVQAMLDYLLAYRARRESGGHINLSLEEDAAVTGQCMP